MKTKRLGILILIVILFNLTGCGWLANHTPTVTPEQAQAAGDAVANVIPVPLAYKTIAAAAIGGIFVKWGVPLVNWFKNKYGTKKV
jgi:hypothetical protein